MGSQYNRLLWNIFDSKLFFTKLIDPTCSTAPYNILFETEYKQEMGGSTPVQGLNRYVPPQRIWFFSHFGHQEGIDFVHFGL